MNLCMLLTILCIDMAINWFDLIWFEPSRPCLPTHVWVTRSGSLCLDELMVPLVWITEFVYTEIVYKILFQQFCCFPNSSPLIRANIYHLVRMNGTCMKCSYLHLDKSPTTDQGDEVYEEQKGHGCRFQYRFFKTIHWLGNALTEMNFDWKAYE